MTEQTGIELHQYVFRDDGRDMTEAELAEFVAAFAVFCEERGCYTGGTAHLFDGERDD